MSRRWAAALAAVLVLSACSGDSSGPAKQAAPAAPPAAQVAPTSPPTTAYPTFTAATAAVPVVEVFDQPEQPSPAHKLENPDSFYLAPRVFHVKEAKGDWLRVLLPMRPNGSSGWIRAGDVELVEKIPFRLVVDVPNRKLTAYNGTDVLLETPVGVGSPSTPTPGGEFYVTQKIEVLPDQQAAYGPYALGLSAYSDVLIDFGGGDGQAGIHGTSATWSIGENVSNGCIRVPNDVIVQLTETLPLGTPVEIKV